MFNKLFSYKNGITISGLNESLINEYIVSCFEQHNKNLLIVSDSIYNANSVYKNIHNLTDDVYFFPMDEFAMAQAISISPELKLTRIDTLNKLDNKNKKIVVTNLTGYLKKIDDIIINLEITYKTKRDELLKFLDQNSYIKTNIVSITGEYAVRSFILDIFPLNSDKPIRIEFFGNDIESIRYFDEETQISSNNINSILLLSCNDNYSLNKVSIIDKLDESIVIFIDYKKIISAYNDYVLYYPNNNILVDSNIFFQFSDIKYVFSIFINSLDDTPILNEVVKFKSKDILNFNNNYDDLYSYVKKNIETNIVVFMINNDILINKIVSLFANDISFNTTRIGLVNIINRNICKGFVFNEYIVISEYDIENINRKTSFINKYKVGRKIKGFDDLKKGDYVVHTMHGIGRYDGLVTLENQGIKKDYLLIKYYGNDKVYVPAQKIETIFKYGDSDMVDVKLNSLNSSLWLNIKEKARKNIKDISDELIRLYANREITQIEKYEEFPEEVIFAKDFEYEETPDQKKSIDDVLKDLSNSKPMDRLLCGDVGFGKTEVAMRAMFRTVINNRQVAYLCPTTILSKQQYNNAIKRFRHFAVNIELVNRFSSIKEVNRISKGIEDGVIDIVIGTHKLLNPIFKFKNLGLLIIDEEQRFGVSQKEKIKEIKNNVNVLTLSATPIPRTLKLAVSGMKDMSLIDTAPVNRYPIQTYVIEENDYILRDAIYKELSREGQVYVLLNNVSQLEVECNKILSLVPEAKICIAHGKMEKSNLDDVIMKFVEGVYNVLLCTTIIETGIDIPNVNTLIIKNADRFGLSQLYQIRGRVGRSDRIAYAYLMYEKNKMLNDSAVKRLKTIKDFTELGSGYKIAIRDLSIRGAGDLLGANQSGYISSIGIDLYMQMINEEINKIKGNKVDENKEDIADMLNVTTSIPKDYVEDESIRIEIHKLINRINSYESFNNVKAEIEDRFGKIDEDIIIYMYEEWFQSLVNKLKIDSIKYLRNEVMLDLGANVSKNIDGEKLFFQIYNINPKFKLKYINKKIIISLNIINRKGDYVKDLLDLLLLIETCIKDNK